MRPLTQRSYHSRTVIIRIPNQDAIGAEPVPIAEPGHRISLRELECRSVGHKLSWVGLRPNVVHENRRLVVGGVPSPQDSRLAKW